MKGNSKLILEIHDTFIHFPVKKTWLWEEESFLTQESPRGHLRPPTSSHLIPSLSKAADLDTQRTHERQRQAVNARAAAAASRWQTGVRWQDGALVLGVGVGVVSYGRFSGGFSNLDDSPIFFGRKDHTSDNLWQVKLQAGELLLKSGFSPVELGTLSHLLRINFMHPRAFFLVKRRTSHKQLAVQHFVQTKSMIVFFCNFSGVLVIFSQKRCLDLNDDPLLKTTPVN